MADQPVLGSPTMSRPRQVGLNTDVTPVAIAGMTVNTTFSDNGVNKTVVTFVNTPCPAMTAANGYGGKKILTFPKGKILPIGVACYLIFTNADITTMEASSIMSVGFGTVTASSATLATTMQNFLPGTGIAVATVTMNSVNAMPAASMTSDKTSALIAIDGSATALPLFLNLGVPTVGGADIDADVPDGGVTVTGTLVILWSNLGGFDFPSQTTTP